MQGVRLAAGGGEVADLEAPRDGRPPALRRLLVVQRQTGEKTVFYVLSDLQRSFAALKSREAVCSFLQKLKLMKQQLILLHYGWFKRHLITKCLKEL